MYEKYLSPEQIEQIAKRRKVLGEKKIKEVEAEWPKLIQAVRAEMERGTPPHDKKVMKLGKKWLQFVELFYGNDAKTGLKLKEMYDKEPSVRENVGIDDALHEYVGKVMYCVTKEAYGK